MLKICKTRGETSIFRSAKRAGVHAAMRAVSAGDRCPGLRSPLLTKVESPLSSRQRDVAELAAGGLPSREIADALARGDRVELRGFGAFSVKERGARIGRNPRTGAAVQVSEKSIPFFKTGKQLRERLNEPQ